ncbi:MAG: hypothetical protein ABIN91_14870 [Mucilaginibacter sp.]|uniref:hypothetical protein n=1 Tax=Mucilaginibacter sp. TaxID=1882438 RepID=UPI003263985C
MKQLLLAALTLFIIQTASAQYREQGNDKKIFISAGGEIGAPSSTPYNFTYGASAQAEVKIINSLGLTLTGEYIAYNYKNTLFMGANTQQHPSFIPLKAGLKYYTGSNFFFAGEIGSTVQSNSGVSNMLVYSLGFGFNIPVNKFSGIDIGFSYQNYDQSQYQTTGLKVAYRVGW